MLSDVNLLGPELVLLVVGGFLLIADLFFKDRRLLMSVAVAALLGSIIYSAILLTEGHIGSQGFGGVLVVDKFAVFFQILLAAAAMAAVLVSTETLRRTPSRRGEYLALILFSTAGLQLLAGARDLIMVFIALELTSISQYILVGFHKDRWGSEGGLKYLLTGAVASAVLLYGMAILLGLTGSTNLSGDRFLHRPGRGEGREEALLLAAVFLIAGFGFKAAVAPFQMWAPDAYTGAPTPIAAYLSVASKAAAFAILIRVFFEALGDDLLAEHWKTIFAVLATLSMFVGNIFAIRQNNIKRMLAYSSVAQAGTLMIGLAAISADRSELLGASGILFYLAGYTVTNLAAFTVIILIANHRGGSYDIRAYAGLGKQSPWLSMVLAFALISLIGLPPTAVFFGKIYLFETAVQSGLTWLAVVGAVNTLISAAYYLRPVKAMFIDSAEDEAAEPQMARPANSVLATMGAGYGRRAGDRTAPRTADQRSRSRRLRHIRVTAVTLVASPS